MRLTLGLLLFIFFSKAFAGCNITDDTGQFLHLSQPAKRIISLAPDLTEILFSISAGDKIIGVIKGCDYPKESLQIPKVGSYSGLDVEKIISLHPDLIVVWRQSFKSEIDLLKKLGFTVYISDPHQLIDIPHSMRNLGCLIGTAAAAEATAKKFEEKMNNLVKTYSNKQKIKVFYQIELHPLMTINHTSWINQILTLCGGENIFANAKWPAPVVNLESILLLNPDVILIDIPNNNGVSTWKKWQEIKAVNKEAVFPVSSDLLARAGPRLLEGMDEICKYLEKSRKQ